MISVLQIPFLCMQMLVCYQFICECHYKASSTCCEEILLHGNQTYEVLKPLLCWFINIGYRRRRKEKKEGEEGGT
jgi:hypothetical protein